jgi:NADPH:quinone reductase-like Zn-dependent oxidoreductase
VPQEQLRAAPNGSDLAQLATLPYSFTTMWLAVRSTGLTPANAHGKRVLINGASGGLGRLCLQLLRGWGSEMTAICGRGAVEDCLGLGAARALERGEGSVTRLPADFHVALNFGGWGDELALASRLGRDALGHATTVHPLLARLDEQGWWGGALASRREWRAMRSAVTSRTPGARYAWTLFKPDREALDVLETDVRERKLSLPIGIRASFEEAGAAFAHVADARPGRACVARAVSCPTERMR